MVADSAEALEITPATHTALRNLVSEGLALFGAPHYREYDFLLTLSDHVTSFGLEHQLLHDKTRTADHGKVLDAIPGMPGAEAGIAPGMKLLAVNGRRWSPDSLREALTAAQRGGPPVTLLMENAEFYESFEIDYRGGQRRPHLERDETLPDLLTQILAPKTIATP